MAAFALAAPILGALISAVGGSMGKSAAGTAQAAGGAAGNKQGLDLRPEFLNATPPPQSPLGYGAVTGGTEQFPEVTGKIGSMTPESKMQQEIEMVNSGKYQGTPSTQTKTVAGTEGVGQSLDTQMQDAFKAPMPKDGGKGGMSFDEKMQLAGLAASLGSVLAGPGAPPPPGAPRGGGIQMAPVFQQMTARGLYG